jgi:endonuclease/exonuclease/phosphatase family metal-dependent hydrolase
MLRTLSLILFFISCFVFSKGQSISIDGNFDDWAGIPVYPDADADGQGIDFTGFSVTNDAGYVYIRLIANTVFNLSDSNSIFINIDADNNASTGFSSNGIGSELGIRVGRRYAFYYYGTNRDTVYPAQMKMAALPTFKNNSFEIAISRNTLVGPLQQLLFSSPVIKLSFVNGFSGGDQMPNSGNTHSYTFNNSSQSSFGAIDISKCHSSYIRLLDYNVLFDGLIDPARQPAFENIFKAVNPDIIVLNECGNTTFQQVRSLLNTWLPISGGASWNCYKVDGSDIVCSRYPVLYAANVSFRRATAVYLDLPSNYLNNLLVIGTHFTFANEGDSMRQREADAIAAYLRDMKAGTTAYKIPANTPFVVAGDLNMVNNPSSLNTLLSGEIVNTADFGTGAPADWNGNNLSSDNAYVADRDATYTWRNQSTNAKWWPGKLDYIIHSNTNLQVKKSFVLQTEIMSAERLGQYNLQANDNLIASDHLALVADFEIPTTAAVINTSIWNGKINTAWENRANWDCSTVPGANSDVVVPSLAPNFPVVNKSTQVKSVNCGQGSSVKVETGVDLKLGNQ